MSTQLKCSKWIALTMTLILLSSCLPALAAGCESGQHVFVAATPSTETSHDGVCAVCGIALAGEHVLGWVDNGDGTHSQGCTVCHFVAEGAVTENHSADRTETIDATCTADGATTVYCKCGATAVQTIPALGHDVDDGVVTSEATCASDGVMTYTCRRCGETATQTVPALGHDVDDGVVTVAATATEDGVMTYTCRRCGETATQAIPATGETNDPVQPLNDEPSQPAGDGSEPCAHEYGSWKDSGESHTRACAKCGHVETASHTYDNGVTTTPATETIDGVMTYTCAICGHQESATLPATGIRACVHEYGDWKYDDAYHARVCAKCGGTESASHTFDDGTVTTAATETSEGVMTYSCTVCGYQKTQSIPAIIHHLTNSWTEKAGDDENHHKYCADAGCDYSESEPHAYGEGQVTTPATETSNGVMTYTCSVCGHQMTADIPALSHNWGEWQNKADDDVNHYKYCADEGCSLFYGEPHVYTDTIVAATCAQEGKIVRTCSVCGHTMEVPLEKIDHVWGSWTATAGEHTRECTVCHEKESASHAFGECQYDAADAEHHFKVCTVCGAKVVEEHAWDEGETVTAASPYATGLIQYRCTAAGCTASKFETLAKTEPALTDRYLYFPIQLCCASNGGHGVDGVELAVATVDFGKIYLGADGYYHVDRTMTFNESWQTYFLDLAGWGGSHKLIQPSDGKVTLTATLNANNEWEAKTIPLTFEDVTDRFTVRFKSGDKVVETYVVQSGDKIGDLPTVNDSEFLGWYYKNGDKVSRDDTVSGNLTVYARYTYTVPKTGNNDHQLMIILLCVSGAMLLVMIFSAVQMIRLSKKSRR